MLCSRAEYHQLNRSLFEAVGAGGAGQVNDTRERQLLPADPPEEAESLRALGALGDSESHRVTRRDLI